MGVKYKVKGPMGCSSVACATGLAAIGEAYGWVRNGDAEYAIAGGVEDVYNTTCLYSSIKLQTMALGKGRRAEEISRPFDEGRAGFVLGEGAGVVILETYESAMRRNAKILGEIVGYGGFSDGYHLTQPDPNGEGASRAMQIAISKANIQPSDISHINSHATSTPVGDEAEAKAINNVFGESKPTVGALKSYLGHTFGASGAIELIVGLKEMEEVG